MSAVVPLRAVLCDLDGTLLDTAPDLAAAINRMLADLGRSPRRVEEVARDIGRGTRRLVERSIAAAGKAVDLERALALFSRHYDEESGRTSRPFPGVVEGLRHMKAQGLSLACVTNKPRMFTVPLLAAQGMEFDAIVCGDDVARLKPDPMPYLEACRRLGVAPREAAVIGDSANDAAAGRAAGCAVLCVPYGYREGAPVESLDCDALVPDFVAAAHWLRSRNGALMDAGT